MNLFVNRRDRDWEWNNLFYLFNISVAYGLGPKIQKKTNIFWTFLLSTINTNLSTILAQLIQLIQIFQGSIFPNYFY